MYSADSLKHIKSPHLKFGDDDTLDAFRVTHVKHVKEHNKEMRKRPHEHRVDPCAVVEYIDPYSLIYICVHVLEPEDQTDVSENVSAVAVHDWGDEEERRSAGRRRQRRTDKAENPKDCGRWGDWYTECVSHDYRDR